MPADTSAPNATADTNPTTPKAPDTVAEAERASGWRTVRKVAPYLWPDDKPWVKQRVVLAMLALILSKAVSVYTPILYRDAVDVLA
ncbi:MAG: metal ABC transporter permease, partial [Tateyamaria sp.]